MVSAARPVSRLAAMFLLLGSACAGAADCESERTIATLNDQIVCHGIILSDCQQLGISSFSELSHLDEQQVRSRFSSSQTRAKMYMGYASLSARSKILVTKSEEQLLLTVLAAKTIIKSIRGLPRDYNPSINRYECQAVIDWDYESFVTFMKSSTFFSVFEQPNARNLWALDSDEATNALRLTYQTLLNQTLSSMKRGATSGTYSVQRLKNGSDVVQIGHIALPVQ